MTGRFSLILVTLIACAFPALATAQTTDPTSGYTGTTTQPPPLTQPKPTPKPKPKPKPDGGAVLPDNSQGNNPPVSQAAPATAGNPAAANPATGSAPSTLAYTGSDVWLVGLVGLLALAGGVALMRSSRGS